MEKSKIVKFLNIIFSNSKDVAGQNHNQGEWIKLKKWVSSQTQGVPYLFALFVEIEGYLLGERAHLSKEVVHEHIFEGKAYSDGRLRNAMMELLRIAQLYLVIDEIQGQLRSFDLLLSAAVLKRGGFESGTQILEKVLNSSAQQPVARIETHHQLFQLNKMLFEEPTGAFRHQSNAVVLQAMEENLDKYYAHEKLVIFQERITRKQVFDKDLSGLEDFQMLLDTVSKNRDSFPGQHVYETIIQNPALSYEEYKRLYMAAFQEMYEDDRKRVLFSLINTAYRDYTSGKKDSLSEILQLYEFGFENRLLIQYGVISDRTFINFIGVALIQQAYELAERITHDFHEYLSPSYREDGRKWALANIYFHQGAYQGAYDQLHGHTFKHESFLLKVKILEIQILFSLLLADISLGETCIFKLNACSKWITRHKDLKKIRKERHLNFLTTLRKLYKITSHIPFNKRKVKALEKVVSQMTAKQVISKQWLQQQVELVVQRNT